MERFGMYPRGHRQFGALVLLALLVLSGLLVLPTHAQAQGNQLVGLVYQCGSPASFIGGATVTLSDAHGIQNPQTVTTLGDGTFSFTPSPGYYQVKVERDGYFRNAATTPVLFNDTETVSLEFCLEPTPTIDKTSTLLVVSQASVARSQVVNFDKSFWSNENAAPSWNAASNRIALAHTPVSSQGMTLRYERLDGTYSKNLANVSDYVVRDYWTGSIEILEPVVIGDLDVDKTRSVLWVSYASWTPTKQLTFFPVLEASYTARKNGASWMAAEGVSWALDIDTGFVTIYGDLINGTDTLAFDYSSVTALAGASIDAYWAAEDQVVKTVVAGTDGRATLNLWSGTFELRTTKSGYAPNVSPLDTATTTKMRIRMAGGVVLSGHARDTAGRFLSAGLQGTLYNLNPAANPAEKAIPVSVVGSLFTFNAPPGSYRMVVDANGYKAANVPVTLVAGTVLQDVTLSVSEKEEYRSTVLYGPEDWSNLTVVRNLTLNADTTLPGLSPSTLRDLRLQVDYTLGTAGTKDGVVSGAEATAFHDWLVANGPLYVTTDSFLTTNGKAYRAAAAYLVTVEGLTAPGGKVWINTTATYSLRQAPPYLAEGAARYFVNVTTMPDQNVSVLQDQVYVVALPRTYEMVSSTVFGSLTTDGYTNITVDPTGLTGSPQVRMVIEKALNGSARARVDGPTGKFHVVNASFDSYRAYVANNTNLTFSAEQSTDPVGDITKANFTWKFLANTPDANLPAHIRYGIRPYYTYTRSGELVVNLTVVETGGNVTYRDITLFVDEQLPLATIRTNRTGTGSANGMTLRADEDLLVRFDGGLSTDLAYTGKTGVILDNGYAWDFDGDRITDHTGRVVNWSFEKPGTFTVNLTVTDSVGWKSVNATMTAIVNDTTPPSPAFDIRDPSNDFSITDRLTEGLTYSFNASRTTDNFDTPTALNYTWKVPGPIEGRTGKDHTFYGMNISFKWTEWNSSYRVVLTVKDTGYPGRTPNQANATRDVPVQVDTAIRPDLTVVTGTMKVTPTDPEDGQQIEITVNVSNKANRGAATNVKARIYITQGGQTIIAADAPLEWRNETDVPQVDRTIASGETVRLLFRVTVSGQGNKTVEVRVSDDTEPYTWITAENRAAFQITVRQAAWVNYAVYGSIVAVIAAFVGYMYYRRKVRAGEWSGIRLRREKAEKGVGESKARKEVREEKKRL